MGIRRRIGTSTKSSPKIFSLEFLTQNHADIVGTIIILIVVGLIFEPTSKHCSKFVALQHNTTSPLIAYEAGLPMDYTYGYNDIFCITFYTMVCVVAHGVTQQYLLDRSARKLHMSKIKHSKFNESGQLLTFLVISILWALEILRRDRLTKKSFIEVIAGSQPDIMSHGMKMYFIIQISYWLHCYPEFYLQRIRKEELSQRMLYVSLYLISFLGAYLFHATRITLVLALLHYIGEATFHLARILYFRHNKFYPTAFKAWNVTFVAGRLVSITLSVLVFALGLGSNAGQQQEGGAISKYTTLSAILAIQVYLMWKYLVFYLGRMRPTDTL